MPLIAVDVVLLPSEEMMDMVIYANKELLRQYPQKIVLDKLACLPHISLAMGCIHQKNVPEIEIILKNTAREHPIDFLSAVRVHVQKNSSGEIVSVLQIENTDLLQELHEHLMKKLSHFFSYDVRADMIFGDESVSKSTLLWIKNYPEKSSYSNFFPHITLGYGEIKITDLPIEFSVSKLALCHLGNHCTCRKVLAEADLTA
jgi:2'-5' RNA ligase